MLDEFAPRGIANLARPGRMSEEHRTELREPAEELMRFANGDCGFW